MSLFSVVDRWAQRSPDAAAIEFEGRVFSYADLVERASERAVALRLQGVGEGDRVAWLGPNHPTALELLLACARIGAILLPLNSRLAVPEHTWILNDAQPKLLISEASFAEHGEAAAAACDGWGGCDGEVAIACEVDAEVGAGGADGGGLSADGAGAPGANAPGGGAPGAPNSGTPDTGAPEIGTPEHAVLLAYTSGTTGHPKGAVLTQGALAANAVNSTHAHDLTRLDRILTVIPMFHVGGLNIQTLPALLGGAAVLIHRGFDPSLFLDDVERWQPTWTVLVPATLAAVSSHPRFAQADLSSLNGIMTGSSPIPPAVTQPYFARGVMVGEIYGATETAPICVHLRADEAADHPGSCGKPSTLCDIRLVANQPVSASQMPTNEMPASQIPAGQMPAGQAPSGSLAPGEAGEIWVKGPNVMREYWRNPEATKAALIDGWYRTGDVAHMDEHGWLYMDDRLTDMIISGGENVYPAEIEEQLAHCPAVSDAAVIGRPDERWGEVPIVIAVPPDDGSAGAADPGGSDPSDGGTSGNTSGDTAAVLDYLRERLARFKQPAAVIWTDALPKTALGKVQKTILRERFIQQ